MYLKRNKGFTLIELLVVIAIIGILSSVVLASLNTAREKSRDAKRISDIKQIQLALELYADSNGGAYPDSTAGIEALVTGGYLPVAPTPPSGAAAAYFYSGKGSGCTDYHLAAQLEADETTNTTLFGSDADQADVDSEADLCEAGTGDFGGDTTDCAAAGGDDRCYDVTP